MRGEEFGNSFCVPQWRNVLHAMFAHQETVHEFMQHQMAATVIQILVIHPELIAEMATVLKLEFFGRHDARFLKAFFSVNDKTGNLKV